MNHNAPSLQDIPTTGDWITLTFYHYLERKDESGLAIYLLDTNMEPRDICSSPSVTSQTTISCKAPANHGTYYLQIRIHGFSFIVSTLQYSRNYQIFELAFIFCIKNTLGPIVPLTIPSVSFGARVQTCGYNLRSTTQGGSIKSTVGEVILQYAVIDSFGVVSFTPVPTIDEIDQHKSVLVIVDSVPDPLNPDQPSQFSAPIEVLLEG